MDSPITRLTPEVLLIIFELISQDGDATLVNSILCCKKWRPLAESVLYGNVFLNAHRLPKFLDTYSDRDRQIQSLTLVMDPIQLNPYDPTVPIQTATARLKDLQRLHSHITMMALISLSITINFPWPYTASFELSSIINKLPESCTCLEIDVEHGGSIYDPRADPNGQPTSHICDAIYTILPQLEHLHLRLPKLYSALFGNAPNLTSYLINLSLREPMSSTSGAWAAPCSYTLIPHLGVEHYLPSALPRLLPRLREFFPLHLNSARLERLWIIDVQTRDPTVPNSWAAWVRRDILSNTSVPIPLNRIGLFHNMAWLARIPTDSGRAED